MEKDEAMLPTNDYVFKRIFGKVGNEEITKGLLSSILKRNIKSIKLDGNKILEKDILDEKVGVLDIRADLDTGEICNIEMQIVHQKNIEQRLLYYWSKLYTSSIKEGEDYKKLHKTIVILIANFEVDATKDVPKFHTKWEIREEEYSKIILTEMLEIDIISLSRLTQELEKNNINKEDKVALWARFIQNPENVGEKEMDENEDIKKARAVLEDIKSSEHDKYIAHLRLKHIMDTKAVEEYGYDKGKAEGRAEGREEKQREIVINMYKKEIKIDDICDITNLAKEEVEKIIEENK